MVRRWVVTALMEAEKKFRRVKGYRYMPQLLAALDVTVGVETLDRKVSVAKNLNQNHRRPSTEGGILHQEIRSEGVREMSTIQALGLSVFMSAVGFFLTLTDRRKEGGQSEVLNILHRSVKAGGWIMAVGGLLLAIRILLAAFGVMSE